MTDVSIRVNQEPGTVTHASEAVEELAADIRAKGRSVSVTLQPDYAAKGLTPPEEILIFVGSAISTTLLNAVVTDVYESAKRWGCKRFGKKTRTASARPREFLIIRADGKKLFWWRIDSGGEYEADYRREFGVVLEATGKRRVRVMKELRSLFVLDLHQAQYVADNTPIRLLDDVDKKTADTIAAALRKVGATIIVTE